jgi:hypothetical protein
MGEVASGSRPDVNLRFPTNLAHLLLGAGVLVACFAFPPAVVTWIALGAGCTAVVASLAGFAASQRGAAQRTIDVVLAGAGGWLIVVSRVLPAVDMKWNAFGVAGLFTGLAAIGLVLHEHLRNAALARLAQRPPTLFEGRWRAREAGFDRHPITAGNGAEASAR